METNRNTVKELGWTHVIYDSDFYEGELLDTTVKIGGQLIIWIEGSKISEFHEKLRNLINEYRI